MTLRREDLEGVREVDLVHRWGNGRNERLQRVRVIEVVRAAARVRFDDGSEKLIPFNKLRLPPPDSPGPAPKVHAAAVSSRPRPRLVDVTGPIVPSPMRLDQAVMAPERPAGGWGAAAEAVAPGAAEPQPVIVTPPPPAATNTQQRAPTTLKCDRCGRCRGVPPEHDPMPTTNGKATP